MTATRERSILHVDLDAFYASVEQRDEPRLRGRPVIVGWPGSRGVVCAASYEARPSGVRSAMSMVEARRRCPDAVIVPPRIAHYAAVSRHFFEILARHTPLVEGLSLDEAFLDATGTEELFGPPDALGARIKRAVREELGIVASVGGAPVKFVAKIASDLGKPDGLLMVDAQALDAFLVGLPVGRLWGVGEVSLERLSTLGIKTVADLRATRVDRLEAALGPARAQHLLALAHGRDDRGVETEREAVSIGHEETFERDISSIENLHAVLLAQAEEVTARLRASAFRARVVTLKVKDSGHELVTRRATLREPTVDALRVAETARELLGRVPGVGRRAFRLTGISLSNLESSEPARGQLALPLPGDAETEDAAAAESRAADLGRAVDAVRAKYGRGAVTRAALLGAPPGRRR